MIAEYRPWEPVGIRDSDQDTDIAQIGSQTLLTTSGFHNTHADVNSRVFDRLGNRGLKLGQHRSGQLSRETCKRGSQSFREAPPEALWVASEWTVSVIRASITLAMCQWIAARRTPCRMYRRISSPVSAATAHPARN
ncbi:hypothetical protein P3T27_007222 [Kitasatospora sp. MAA19]|uniref:hypothetical protein n=1 Tax=Kitasatospora sp. MAA19 TaxID=3035090 RepID=UPI002475DE05|nr:hypothetical protein [Kitasatospora sp. MAA19]MDH6710472.1 hypothetical protein [Kitasatospora sp. MAA19]